eukprot:247965-Pelagomonas_calceolata.AAC.8
MDTQQLPELSFSLDTCSGGTGETTAKGRLCDSQPICQPFFASISAPLAPQTKGAPRQYQGPPMNFRAHALCAIAQRFCVMWTVSGPQSPAGEERMAENGA